MYLIGTRTVLSFFGDWASYLLALISSYVLDHLLRTSDSFREALVSHVVDYSPLLLRMTLYVLIFLWINNSFILGLNYGGPFSLHAINSWGMKLLQVTVLWKVETFSPTCLFSKDLSIWTNCLCNRNHHWNFHSPKHQQK